MKTSALKRSVSMGLGILALASTQLFSQEQPAQKTYPVPPQGFDAPRDGIEKGNVERVEYDAPAISELLRLHSAGFFIALL